MESAQTRRVSPQQPAPPAVTAWKAEPPPGRARELSNRGHLFEKMLRAAFPRRQRPSDSPGYPGEQTADLPSCRGPGRLRFRWLGRRRVFRAIALCGRSLEGPGGATSVLRALGFSAPRVPAQGPGPGSPPRVPRLRRAGRTRAVLTEHALHEGSQRPRGPVFSPCHCPVAGPELTREGPWTCRDRVRPS